MKKKKHILKNKYNGCALAFGLGNLPNLVSKVNKNTDTISESESD